MKFFDKLFGKAAISNNNEIISLIEPHWYAFPRHDSNISTITVDINFHQIADIKKFCAKVCYEYLPKQLMDNLIPYQESWREVYEVEDALNESYKTLQLIGTRTGNGKREIWYLDSDDRIEAKLNAVYRIFNYCPVKVSIENPSSIKVLLPTSLEAQLDHNRRVFDLLKKNGDDPNLPRQIDFTFDCSDQTDIAKLEKALNSAGYSFVSKESDTAIFQRFGLVDVVEMDKETIELNNIAHLHGAEFNGWGCVVAR